MSFLTSLPTPDALMNQSPLSTEVEKTISFFRLTGEHIMRGEDDRLIIFAGPGSIHDTEIARRIDRHSDSR